MSRRDAAPKRSLEERKKYARARNFMRLAGNRPVQAWPPQPSSRPTPATLGGGFGDCSTGGEEPPSPSPKADPHQRTTRAATPQPPRTGPGVLQILFPRESRRALDAGMRVVDEASDRNETHRRRVAEYRTAATHVAETLIADPEFATTYAAMKEPEAVSLLNDPGDDVCWEGCPRREVTRDCLERMDAAAAVAADVYAATCEAPGGSTEPQQQKRPRKSPPDVGGSGSDDALPPERCARCARVAAKTNEIATPLDLSREEGVRVALERVQVFPPPPLQLLPRRFADDAVAELANSRAARAVVAEILAMGGPASATAEPALGAIDAARRASIEGVVRTILVWCAMCASLADYVLPHLARLLVCGQASRGQEARFAGSNLRGVGVRVDATLRKRSAAVLDWCAGTSALRAPAKGWNLRFEAALEAASIAGVVLRGGQEKECASDGMETPVGPSPFTPTCYFAVFTEEALGPAPVVAAATLRMHARLVGMRKALSGTLLPFCDAGASRTVERSVETTCLTLARDPDTIAKRWRGKRAQRARANCQKSTDVALLEAGGVVVGLSERGLPPASVHRFLCGDSTLRQFFQALVGPDPSVLQTIATAARDAAVASLRELEGKDHGGVGGGGDGDGDGDGAGEEGATIEVGEGGGTGEADNVDGDKRESLTVAVDLLSKLCATVEAECGRQHAWVEDKVNNDFGDIARSLPQPLGRVLTVASPSSVLAATKRGDAAKLPHWRCEALRLSRARAHRRTDEAAAGVALQYTHGGGGGGAVVVLDGGEGPKEGGLRDALRRLYSTERAPGVTEAEAILSAVLPHVSPCLGTIVTNAATVREAALPPHLHFKKDQKWFLLNMLRRAGVELVDAQSLVNSLRRSSKGLAAGRDEQYAWVWRGSVSHIPPRGCAAVVRGTPAKANSAGLPALQGVCPFVRLASASGEAEAEAPVALPASLKTFAGAHGLPIADLEDIVGEGRRMDTAGKSSAASLDVLERARVACTSMCTRANAMRKRSAYARPSMWMDLQEADGEVVIHRRGGSN